MMVEAAVLRLLGESAGRVPAPLVAWLVSGELPAQPLRWDVSFPHAGSRLPGI
ncbi:hypothetical protein [Mycobacterium sp.]|uniref:hypothetical protein n=1 Tax=Mycobacterium sp. TaxID=1785 RepID=UPI002C8F896F|nr:hypothetical protein [Mycobacterium sp.]HTY33804.1 hypothetical protein [Mycobacterium sp.]